MKLAYRSSSLKRGELNGIILQVLLKKKQGDANKLKILAENHHAIRKMQQPSGVNNLGTTYIGRKPTIKGWIVLMIEKTIMVLRGTRDSRRTFPFILRLFGKKEFVPYVYYWNRYMFIDEKSHTLFPQYTEFLKTLYSDLHLEIEIRK